MMMMMMMMMVMMMVMMIMRMSSTGSWDYYHPGMGSLEGAQVRCSPVRALPNTLNRMLGECVTND
eukprot:3838548-Karenia_brevis.AAC.1